MLLAEERATLLPEAAAGGDDCRSDDRIDGPAPERHRAIAFELTI